MSSKKMEIGSRDVISSLPDALIGHILSFLSTKDAALTSVLSQRWRNLLAFVPNLDLNNSIYDHPGMGRQKEQHMRKSFKVFVDRVMAMQGNASLNKFSLRCKIGRDPSFVNGWILNALDRGVVDLDLYICSRFSDYSLPSEVLMSKTLVTLKVGGRDKLVIVVKEEVFLPKLKTLYLRKDVSFSDESGAAFAKLISSCHALEELFMVQVICSRWDSFSVSNPTLKRLTIRDPSDRKYPKSVSFDTPYLLYLEFTDTVALKYPKANFDSLVEAIIGLRMPSVAAREGVEAGDAEGFLMGISNVKILYLSSETLEVLALRCKAVPVFKNLIQLTIQTEQEVEWEALPNLLENCPNLETLVFDGLHYKDTKQCLDESHRFKDTYKCYVDKGRCECKPWAGTPIWLSSSPVKILKVLKFGEISNDKDDMDKQIYLVEYFLETMPNLEQVILYYDTSIDGDLSIVSSDFQMLKRVASPKCKIQVVSDNISFSTTVGSSLSTIGLAMFYPRELRED